MRKRLLVGLLVVLLVTSPAVFGQFNIDLALAQQDQAVLSYFTRNFMQDHRSDRYFQRIFARLTPHLAQVYPDPQKEVTPYVFVSNLGFNAMTWDHIIIFDALLIDTFHRLSEGVTLYGDNDNPYFWSLARAVNTLQMETSQLPRIADPDSPNNLYHLPVAGNLTSVEQGEADSLFEEMLASWLGHEASHAFLNHARQRMLAEQAMQRENWNQNGNALGSYIQNFGLMNNIGVDKEREADEHGAILITRSGYSLRGFVVSLEFAGRLEELSGANSVYLRSHPPARERIADIERVVAAESNR